MGQRSYSLSWAPALSVALPSPFVPLLYHTLRGLSRGIFAFAGLFLLGVPYHPSWRPLRGLPLDCSYIVPHLEWFVKGFPTFSQNFFSRAPTPVLHSQWQAFVYGYPLPLTLQIIAHPPPDYNRQNAQNRDFYFLDICATFLLTNCWRCVIMEICAPHTRGRAAEILCIMYKKPTAFVSRSQKRWGNSFQIVLAISGATPIAFS